MIRGRPATPQPQSCAILNIKLCVGKSPVPYKIILKLSRRVWRFRRSHAAMKRLARKLSKVHVDGVEVRGGIGLIARAR